MQLGDIGGNDSEGLHVICEILDSRTRTPAFFSWHSSDLLRCMLARSLSSVAAVSDYVMSHELVSKYLAMVAGLAAPL